MATDYTIADCNPSRARKSHAPARRLFLNFGRRERAGGSLRTTGIFFFNHGIAVPNFSNDLLNLLLLFVVYLFIFFFLLVLILTNRFTALIAEMLESFTLT